LESRAIILTKITPGDIRRSRDIGRVVNELEELDEAKSWRVTFEECKSERSLKQNRYLFGVAYKILSAETGCEKDDLHRDLLCKHFGTRIKKVPRSKYCCEGLAEVPLRTTTTNEHGRRSVLGKLAFSEFVDFVKRWAAEGGIFIPDPDPSLGIYAREGEEREALAA
jgi:hypothetical protein